MARGKNRLDRRARKATEYKNKANEKQARAHKTRAPATRVMNRNRVSKKKENSPALSDTVISVSALTESSDNIEDIAERGLTVTFSPPAGSLEIVEQRSPSMNGKKKKTSDKRVLMSSIEVEPRGVLKNTVEKTAETHEMEKRQRFTPRTTLEKHLLQENDEMRLANAVAAMKHEKMIAMVMELSLYEMLAEA